MKQASSSGRYMARSRTMSAARRCSRCRLGGGRDVISGGVTSLPGSDIMPGGVTSLPGSPFRLPAGGAAHARRAPREELFSPPVPLPLLSFPLPAAMSELILNVSFALGGSPRPPPAGSRRHRSFVRRRRLLERLGALKEKQLPPNARRKPKEEPKKAGAGGGGGGRPGRAEGRRRRRGGTKWRRAASGGGEESGEGAPKGLKGSGGGPEDAGAHPKGAGGPSEASAPPPKGSGGSSKGSGPSSKDSGPVPKGSGPPLKGSGSSKDSDPPHKASGAPLKASGPSSKDSQPPPKASGAPPKASGPPPKGSLAPPAPSKLVAIDCEMVGTGPGGRTSSLARCSIVSYEGDVLYDRYVRPPEPVVDYRTRWSGIRRHHLVNAVPFSKAQREIVKLLRGKVVVGHALHNDLRALRYAPPPALTRDTSRMAPLNQRAGCPPGTPVSLKRLAKALLQRDIQVGNSGHCSVEDARTCMELYRLVEAEWEQHQPPGGGPDTPGGGP